MNILKNIFNFQLNNGFILTTEENIGASNSINYGAQLFYYLLMLFIVVVIAYCVTKLISKNKFRGLNSKNIKIIEMISVSVGMSLAIIKVGEQYFLVSISKERINLVSEINGEELLLDDKQNTSYDFNEQFMKILKNYKGNKDDKEIL